jgi:hypothetical protein
MRWTKVNCDGNRHIRSFRSFRPGVESAGDSFSLHGKAERRCMHFDRQRMSDRIKLRAANGCGGIRILNMGPRRHYHQLIGVKQIPALSKS